MPNFTVQILTISCDIYKESKLAGICVSFTYQKVTLYSSSVAPMVDELELEVQLPYSRLTYMYIKEIRHSTVKISLVSIYVTNGVNYVVANKSEK